MRKIGIAHAEVDATKIIEDSDEFLVVPAVIAREGVFKYLEDSFSGNDCWHYQELV